MMASLAIVLLEKQHGHLGLKHVRNFFILTILQIKGYYRDQIIFQMEEIYLHVEWVTIMERRQNIMMLHHERTSNEIVMFLSTNQELHLD